MRLIKAVPRNCGAAVCCGVFLGISTTALWASNHVPAAIDVVVSNSSNSGLFWADFDAQQAVKLNSDANQSSGLGSLAIHYNACETRMDIVAANTNGGDLLLYPGGADRWNAATESLCTAGNCPARPVGLSASNERLLAAAHSGAAGGVPALWFFTPAACNGSTTFQAGLGGTQFMAGPNGGSPVGNIFDTEFVRVAGGGLQVGDLLVATGSPNLIARVRKSHIDALLGPSKTPLPAADILVPASFFGSSSPAAMAFVPGTSGIGSSSDQTSESEDLLVTVPPGRVLKLPFGSTTYASASLQNFVFMAQELGNGPLGIAAGTRDGETYMVVADRQLGRAIKVGLHVDSTTGDLSLCASEPCAPGDVDITVIKQGLQFPLGLEINNDAKAAGACATPEGCSLAGAISLFLPQPAQADSDGIVIGQLFLVEDSRGTANTSLALPAGLGGNYSLPAACRGFDLDDDLSTPPTVPVVLLTTNVDIEPGKVVQLQELLAGIFPQLENCDETGARIYHSSLPGALADQTVHCINPSRGINGPNLSPFAICADWYYRPAGGGSLSNAQKTALKSEVFARIASLEAAVALLPDVVPFTALEAGLLARLAEVRDVLKKARPSQSEYLAASAILTAGAKHVVQVGNESNFPDQVTYGDLLTRWLALAFYSSETAAMTPYCPTEDGVLAEALPGIPCGANLN